MKSKHPNYVVGYDGSLEKLASAIGNMSYDQTAKFVKLLALDLRKQSLADSLRGREMLSDHLLKSSEILLKASDEIDLAWKVCKPFM